MQCKVLCCCFFSTSFSSYFVSAQSPPSTSQTFLALPSGMWGDKGSVCCSTASTFTIIISGRTLSLAKPLGYCALLWSGCWQSTHQVEQSLVSFCCAFPSHSVRLVCLHLQRRSSFHTHPNHPVYDFPHCYRAWLCTWHSSPCAYILQVYVLLHHQGQKVGTSYLLQIDKVCIDVDRQSLVTIIVITNTMQHHI